MRRDEIGVLTVLEPRPQKGFVETDYVQNVVARARSYLEAGFPVHFRGGAGTGKTTFALHLAHLVNRPVVLIHGDEEFSTSHLVGDAKGYRMRRVVDNFIHSVLKTEEDFVHRWVDSRLTLACKYGLTLVYDEFTRSRPEANNVLLSVLQERMMEFPIGKTGQGDYLQVHPEFRAIFTSNPEEYAGTHKAQDALRDRMVTIDLAHLDRETEIAITASKSGISREEAEKVVDLVRAFRTRGRCEFSPTVRAPIMIAKVASVRQVTMSPADACFQEICLDVLRSESSRSGVGSNGDQTRRLIHGLIQEFWAGSRTGAPSGQRVLIPRDEIAVAGPSGTFEA